MIKKRPYDVSKYYTYSIFLISFQVFNFYSHTIFMNKKLFIGILFIIVLISGCISSSEDKRKTPTGEIVGKPTTTSTSSTVTTTLQTTTSSTEPPSTSTSSTSSITSSTPSTILPTSSSTSTTTVTGTTITEPTSTPSTSTITTTVLSLTVVSKVIDGDTVELENGERVRLLGINTPEKGQNYYEEANNRLKELVEGKGVRLEKDVDDKGKYGRLLRYVFINDEFVNLKLVREGYAHVYVIPPNTKYQTDLEKAEEKAKEEGLRIWNSSENFGCIGIAYFRWNAEGNDCNNPNGEYVTFKNTCPEPVNMKGWTVKDRGTNIYTFPEVSLPSNEMVTLYSGPGKDTSRELYWDEEKQCPAIWNNDGDSLYLRDEEGYLVVDYDYPEETVISTTSTTTSSIVTPTTTLSSSTTTTSIISATTSTIQTTTSTTSTTVSSEVYIKDAQFDAPGNERENLNGEWVEICDGNTDMKDWSLNDEGEKHKYSFPNGFVLEGCVKVHTGSGTDTSKDLYMGRGAPIWNNDGDIATLKNENGDVIDQWSG